MSAQSGLDGQQLSAMGAGGAVGAILFSLFVLRNPTPRMTQLSALFEGILLVLAGLSGNFWLLLLLLAGIGLMETVVATLALFVPAIRYYKQVDRKLST